MTSLSLPLKFELSSYILCILSCAKCDGNENSLLWYNNSFQVWYWIGSGTEHSLQDVHLPGNVAISATAGSWPKLVVTFTISLSVDE
jgi:hypothetical protein